MQDIQPGRIAHFAAERRIVSFQLDTQGHWLIRKDPVAVKDYIADLSECLGTALLDLVVIAADDGINVDSWHVDGTGQQLVIWLSGGLSPRDYRVRIRWIDDSDPPRADSRSFRIKVREL
jgi:hypothetical protein